MHPEVLALISSAITLIERVYTTFPDPQDSTVVNQGSALNRWRPRMGTVFVVNTLPQLVLPVWIYADEYIIWSSRMQEK